MSLALAAKHLESQGRGKDTQASPHDRRRAYVLLISYL
jgi:hypothetical protein